MGKMIKTGKYPKIFLIKVIWTKLRLTQVFDNLKEKLESLPRSVIMAGDCNVVYVYFLDTVNYKQKITFGLTNTFWK